MSIFLDAESPYAVHNQWAQECPYIRGPHVPIHCAQLMGTGILPYTGSTRPHTLCTTNGHRNTAIYGVHTGPYTVHNQWAQEYCYIWGPHGPIHCAQPMGTGLSSYSGTPRPHTLCTTNGHRNIAIFGDPTAIFLRELGHLALSLNCAVSSVYCL